jgi:hypothetical protein
VHQMETRSMWPGHAQYASAEPFAPLTIQDSDDPSFPDPIYSTVGTGLALDAGRWIVLVRVHLFIIMAGASGSTIGFFTQAVTSEGLQTREVRIVSGVTSEPTDGAWSMALELISDTPSTVTVSAFAGSPPGYLSGDASLYRASIVAFPG